MTPRPLHEALFFALLVALPLVLFCRCATPLTPEGRKELTRRDIHERHSWCIEAGDLYARVHGQDALRYFQCDANSDAECHAVGLEHSCDQWIAGGF